MGERENIYKAAIIILCILLLIVTIFYKDEIDFQEKERYMPPPPNTENSQYIKGMDYSRPGNNFIYYTDEEIRELRSNNTDVIIKIPGRRVLSREDQLREDYEELLLEIEDETSYLNNNQ